MKYLKICLNDNLTYKSFAAPLRTHMEPGTLI